jgi:uncharacterized protein Veg
VIFSITNYGLRFYKVEGRRKKVELKAEGGRRNEKNPKSEIFLVFLFSFGVNFVGHHLFED